MEVGILIANRNRFCGIFESSVTQCVYAYMIVCDCVCVCVGVCVCVHLLLCYCMHNIAYTRFVRLLIDWVKASNVLERDRERQGKRHCVRERECGAAFIRSLASFWKPFVYFAICIDVRAPLAVVRCAPLEAPVYSASLFLLCFCFAILMRRSVHVLTRKADFSLNINWLYLENRFLLLYC